MTPSTQAFVALVRGVAGTLATTSEAAESNPPQSQMDAYQTAIRGAAFWLVADVYHDYEAADLSDMPDEARSELGFCIQRLRHYIAQFSPEQGPPHAIYEASAPIFLRLTQLIDTYYLRPRAS